MQHLCGLNVHREWPLRGYSQVCWMGITNDPSKLTEGMGMAFPEGVNGEICVQTSGSVVKQQLELGACRKCKVQVGQEALNFGNSRALVPAVL